MNRDLDDDKKPPTADKSHRTHSIDRDVAEAIALIEEALGAPISDDDPLEPPAGNRCVVHSSAMQRTLKRVERVARSQSTVLLTGESGVGKSLVAKRIHERSSRSERPFVAVNCASLPRDLIEAELFGHTSGAFTGAMRDRAGRVEAARTGTLFLDEIGDLPMELQPKLLTFLQDRTFQRIGSDIVHESDVRVIAATNHNLCEMRDQGLFRDDLYYRLNVLAIRIPPLRERLDELPELVAELIRRNPDPGLSHRTFDKTAMRRLRNHDWPGNVRELDNVIERSLVFSDNETLGEEDIVFDDGFNEAQELGAERASSLTLHEMEELAIRAALERSDGNRAQAAVELGISERSIYNKLRRYGMSNAK